MDYSKNPETWEEYFAHVNYVKKSMKRGLLTVEEYKSKMNMLRIVGKGGFAS